MHGKWHSGEGEESFNSASKGMKCFLAMV